MNKEHQLLRPFTFCRCREF